ncbi:DUF7535 family protein [Natronomonas sp. EA1]|uniref:DUF7535 family protein n=1 Tax=Natronomonas sp. EA1 TaxID=3421655 RepID=UPI003EB7BFAE
MSTEGETEKPGLPGTVGRTVTPGYRGHPDTEMHLLGLLWGALLIVLVLPVLPFVVFIWLVGKTRSFLSKQTRREEPRVPGPRERRRRPA